MDDLLGATFSAVKETFDKEEDEQPTYPSSIDPSTGFLSEDVRTRKSHTPLPFETRLREAVSAQTKRRKSSTQKNKTVESLPRQLYPPVASTPKSTERPSEFEMIETFPPKTPPPATEEMQHMFSEHLTPKKRGRPPGPSYTTPPASPKKTPPASSKLFPDLRAKRIKQIKEYMNLYPEIQNDLPYDWEKFSDKILDDTYFKCRIRATDGMEFQMICSAFFRAIGTIEDLVRLLVDLKVLSLDLQPVRLIAGLPSGSIAQYIEYGIKTQDPDSGYLELREIAIDWMGYFPQNPYVRLIIKVGYKIYDVIQFEQNKHLQNINNNFEKAARTRGPMPDDLLERLNSCQ